MRESRILVGDALAVLKTLPDESVQCCVTSPPYWGLRDYGVEGQIGLERTPDEYIARMVEVFREVRRVLRSDGTCWVNMGDSYCVSPKGSDNGWDKSGLTKPIDGRPRSAQIAQAASIANPKTFPGLKPKDLVGIPWMLAFALRADGWWLRSDIIWSKPNPMPESVTDRPTKAHEYIFLLSKSATYFYDAEAIKEPWTCNLDDMREKGVRTGTAYLQQGANGYDNSVKPPKQDGLGKRTYTGFNQRWDESEANGSLGAGRNKRTVWEIATSPFPEAHFATFPPALVEPCIKAGTSERGCCLECGAPTERIVETNNPSKCAADDDARGWANTHQKTSNAQSSKSLHRDGSGVYSTAVTKGWRPTCDCGKPETSPCTVLDPFSGAGTTGLVASRLGRNFIGIELNRDYAEMAERRIRNDAPMFNTVEMKA